MRTLLGGFSRWRQVVALEYRHAGREKCVLLAVSTRRLFEAHPAERASANDSEFQESRFPLFDRLHGLVMSK